MKTYGEHRFPGRLFVVEGLDGSGKSTQLQLLKQWLDGEGYSVIESSWNSSKLVKETTKQAKKKQMFTPTTFSMLHATDFADRIEREIIPPLQAGAIVLCDRYIYTAFARDASRGCDPQWVRDMYRFAVKPTLAFYFRVPLDIACKRILGGRGEIKFYEAGMDLGLSTNLQESFQLFQGRIMTQYDAMAKEFELMVMDATLPVEEQQEQMRSAVKKKLEDAKRIRVRRWVQLSPTVRGYRD
jgi:dTMP kinase